MTTPHAILVALSRVHPYMLPETAMLVDVNAQIGRAITLTQLRQDLGTAEAKRWVINVPDGDTGDPRWRITDHGRAELLSRA